MTISRKQGAMVMRAVANLNRARAEAVREQAALLGSWDAALLRLRQAVIGGNEREIIHAYDSACDCEYNLHSDTCTTDKFANDLGLSELLERESTVSELFDSDKHSPKGINPNHVRESKLPDFTPNPCDPPRLVNTHRVKP